MRIGIVGYGNLGCGVEAAAANNDDIELTAIFTRRDPGEISPKAEGVTVDKLDNIDAYKDKIDVMVICAGSATDLPEMTPLIASKFSCVDSFDTHANIPEHFKKVDEAASASGHTALISCGWDPGLFSLARLYGGSVLPGSKAYTFWGRGVSQGHSDAIRRIPGVLDARQYTNPVPEAMERVRSGELPELSTREKHTRECYVVAEEGADKAAIEKAIKEMPNYFADYDTTVEFISQEEMARDHAGLPHGGSVILTGKTGMESDNDNTFEFGLKLDSNPLFTGSVLVAFARAIGRMDQAGYHGCLSVFDVPPALLSPLTGEELRATLL